MQHKSSCANANQRHPSLRRAVQELCMVGIQILQFLHQPAHDNDVVKPRRVTQSLFWLNRNATAGNHWTCRCGQHPPAAQDRARAIALIRRKTQYINEIGKGAKSKAPGKDEPDPQTRCRGWSGGCLHGRIPKKVWRNHNALLTHPYSEKSSRLR